MIEIYEVVFKWVMSNSGSLKVPMNCDTTLSPLSFDEVNQSILY